MFSLLRRLRARLKYRHHERDLAQEIEIHRAMAQQDLEARGLTTADARPAAIRALGNTTYMREEARSVWIARWVEQLRQDLRYAGRGMRRQPGFSIAAILILALGVSTLTVAYSLTNARLLRPWQVANPDSVLIVRARPAPQQQYGSLTVSEALYFAEHASTAAALATFIPGGEKVDRDGPEVQSRFVTSQYFDVMGVRVVSGPGFTPGSDANPAVREVVISDHLWKTYFNADPSIAGRTVQLSHGTSVPYTIVGVAEPGFEDVANNRAHLWMYPLNLGDRSGGSVVARLRPGVSADQAQAELEGLSTQYRNANNIPSYGLILSDTRPISSGRPAQQQEYLFIFAGLTLILFLTCANVGSLLLARSLRRQREIAVRLSLGAGRWRVARQFLTETFLLTLCAGGVGVALAYALPRITVSLSGNTGLRTGYLAPDWTVLAFAVGVSAIAALLAGSSAARGVGRLSLAQAVAQQHGPDRHSRRSRGLLLTAQVAITVVFLTGAGLVGRAAIVASAADPGFATDDIDLVQISFREQLTSTRRAAFAREFLPAVENAGMTHVAFAQSAPLIRGASTSIRLHQPNEHPSMARVFASRPVSANYFSVMRIPVLDGVAPDPATASGQVMVNESFARAVWPGGRAVGQTLINPDSKNPTALTVGAVVRDVPIRSLGTFEPVVYLPSRSLPLLLVPNTDPGTLELLQAVSQAIEPAAVLTPTPMREVVRQSFSETANASLVGWMVGAAALLISTLGIFGVFSYAVEERRREIGIRIALGGAARHVTLQVLRAGQRATAVGVSLGFLVSAVGASLLRSQLFGLQPFDVLTYLQVATILAAATMLALWIPARRATRVDPAITLRCE